MAKEIGLTLLAAVLMSSHARSDVPNDVVDGYLISQVIERYVTIVGVSRHPHHIYVSSTTEVLSHSRLLDIARMSGNVPEAEFVQRMQSLGGYEEMLGRSSQPRQLAPLHGNTWIVVSRQEDYLECDYDNQKDYAAVLRFGQIGFGRDGTSALVYMESRDCWSVSSALYVLEREDSWKLKYPLELYVTGE